MDAVGNGRLPKAILFSGPKALGKSSAALWLAQLCLCQSEGKRPCEICSDCRLAKTQIHPRQVVVQPSESGRINIEEIRSALHQFLVVGSAKTERWLVVPDAERLTESASNTLLKFIEELPSHTRAIMTTSQPAELLTTLKSRLTVFYWHLVPANTLRNLSDTKKALIARAAGRPGWLMEIDEPLKDSIVKQLLGLSQIGGQNTTNTYSADRKISDARLDSDELLAREILLNASGSRRRQLWPESQPQLSKVAEQIGISRLIDLTARYLDRHQYSLNIQPRLLYEDLHLV